MLNFLYEKSRKIATPKIIFILGVIFIFLTVTILSKPFGVARLKEISGGIGILDTEINYSPEAAYQLLNSLGDQGRHFYVNILILDFVFLLSYTLFFVSLSIFMLKRWLRARASAKSACQKLGLFPVLAGAFDFLENSLILFILLNYPKKFFNVAFVANLATLTKDITFLLSILLIIISFTSLGFKKISKKKN